MNFILILITMLIASLFGLFILDKFPNLVKEHGMVENMQVIVLCASAVSFLFSAKLYQLKNVSFLSAAVCVGFTLREVSFRNFIFVGDMIEYKQTVTYLFVSAIILLGILRIEKLKIFTKVLCKEALIVLEWMPKLRPLIILFISCMILSWVFDKNVFRISKNMKYEEIVEVCGYFTILIASLSYASYLRKLQSIHVN